MALAADLATEYQMVLSGNKAQICWRRAYSRGVGVPVSTCPANKQKDGLLCYPFCREGYHGVGPDCWQSCPSNFHDDGVFCRKPRSYGRGFGSLKQCDHCEKWGALYYPKCREGFHHVACCVCSPDCPHGMTDIGISCTKHSYGRLAGTPLVCKHSQENNAGLCYTPCKTGDHGVGPLCWERCPVGTKACSALCLPSKEDCTDHIIHELMDVVELASDIAGGCVAGTVIDIAEIVYDSTYPKCVAYHQTALF